MSVNSPLPRLPSRGRAIAKEIRQSQKERWRFLGRKIAIASQVNILIALILPWVQIENAGVSAFHLSIIAPLIEQRWILTAIWGLPFLALLMIAVAGLDILRPLGRLPAIATLATAFLEFGFGGYIFLSERPLRNFGAASCIVSGGIALAGAIILARSRWSSSIGGEQRDEPRFPWATTAIIVVNTALFFILSLRSDYDSILREFGLIGGSLRWHAFLTSILLHANVYHLLLNMLFLGAVGVLLERRIGRLRTLAVFLISGIAGGVFSVLIDPRFFLPSIGSSGAIAGVIACCAVVVPAQKVRLFLHLFVTILWIRIPVIWLFAVWLTLQSLSAIFIALGDINNVGYWSHIGGAVVGLCTGLILRRMGSVHREPLPSPEPVSDKEARLRKYRSQTRGDPWVLLPSIIAGIAFAVSLLAVVLTFTSVTLLGTLASFQRAWNRGDMT